MMEIDSTVPSQGKPPAFRFYPGDFISDEKVRAMDLAAVGAYVMLICNAWIEGSIPSDQRVLARIVGMPLRDFATLWTQIEPCWRPAAEGRLIQPRLELERTKQEEYTERQRSNGARGGRPRKRVGFENGKPEKPVGYSGETQNEANLKPARPRFSFSFSLSEFLASLETARGEENSQSVPSNAFGFAQWFVSRGLDAGVIAPDRGLDLVATAGRESLPDAEALLVTYPPAEIERRLGRFFAAKIAGEIRRAPTIANFRDAWDWAVVSGIATPSPIDGKKQAVTDGQRELAARFAERMR